ncbi:MAG: hypothetical protein IAG10_30950 [Planctomycetaceae bacterium]|nr:hypothetical protein [Planctomycetaceae bacterium]
MRLERLIFGFGKTSRRQRATWLGVVALVLASGLLSRSMADDKPAKTNKPADATKPTTDKSDKRPISADKAPAKRPVVAEASKADAEPISPKREKAAVAFAQQHHPELAELLTRLKASHPDQYTKALRELDRTRERLEKAQEKDSDRYAILLREWQLDSRVRLLAARMTMGGTPELETELRQVLLERHDVRLQLLTYDREKSKARFLKMDEQIAEHVQNREASVDRELDKIKKNADLRKRSLTKPATKRPADK